MNDIQGVRRICRGLLSILLLSAASVGCRDNFLAAEPELPEIGGNERRIFFMNLLSSSPYIGTLSSIEEDGSGERAMGENICILTAQPGGGRIVYLQIDPAVPEHRLIVSSLDGTDTQVIDRIDAPRFIGRAMAVSPDGTIVIYTTGIGNVSTDLHIYDLAAKQKKTIPLKDLDPTPHEIPDLRFSSDGRMVAAILWGFETQIVLFDLTGKVVDTISGCIGSSLAWSPRGDAIAYTWGCGLTGLVLNYNGLGHWLALGTTLMATTLEGKESRTIVADTVDMFNLAWSPNGAQIAYSRRHTRGLYPISSDVCVVPAGGGAPRNLTGRGEAALDTLVRSVLPQWSRDGRSIIYSEVISFSPGGAEYGAIKRINLESSSITTLANDAYAGFPER